MGITLGSYYQKSVQLLSDLKAIKDGKWTEDGYKPLILPTSSLQRIVEKEAIIQYFRDNKIDGTAFDEMEEKKFVNDISKLIDIKEEQKEDEQPLNALYNAIKKYFKTIKYLAHKEVIKLLEQNISLSSDHKLATNLVELVQNIQKY